MIIIITILALIALCISKLRRHPVDKLPGPPTLPFVGNLLTFVGTPEEMFEKFNTFARDFWPLYRTWQLNTPVIHPLLPEHVEKVLASSKNTQKSRDYRFVESWLGTGLFTSNGAKWQERRKLLAPTFHLKVLEQFVPTISDNAAVLAQKLQLLLCQSPNEPIDVVPLVTLCALDIICETAMGRSIRAQHKDSKNTEYVSSIHRIMDLIVYRAMRPWLHPHWIFRVSPTGREFAKCLRTLHRFTRNVIDEKRLEREQGELEIKVVPSVPTSNGYEDLERISVRNRLVFLDLLLKLNEWDCKLSDQEICEEVDTFMFGGHDTTSNSISWALFYLGCNLKIQEEVFNEIEGSDLSNENLNSFKLLDRVIKETLRLRPPAYMIFRLLEQPLQLDDVVYPSGTKVNIHIYDVQQNPAVFPNPEKFEPDRFLPENMEGRHPFAYIPFSGGPRNCVGTFLALWPMQCI
ncbi:Hypothetical predicted protein [Cloeon dipterum]|uniref:Cytochrome P450 n=1 Tax=Cloeon dipterum TaxID=197152 RepID=A0A8S1D4B1_9INSE|nr:Hypothetical predicted protein [Cloeon dipterum]